MKRRWIVLLATVILATVTAASVSAVGCHMMGASAGSDQNVINVTWGWSVGHDCVGFFTVERAVCGTDKWVTIGTSATSPYVDVSAVSVAGARRYRVTMTCTGNHPPTTAYTQCITPSGR